VAVVREWKIEECPNKLEHLQWKEQKKKRGRARKRCRYEVQGLNIMGINKRKTMVRDRRGYGEIVLEATVHNVLWRLSRRTGEEEEEQEEEEVEEEEK